jgi:DnaJ domain
MNDYYAILNVPDTADQDNLTEAYRQRVMTCHPTQYHSHLKENYLLEQLDLINEAYNVLYNPETRARYDEARIKLLRSYKEDVKKPPIEKNSSPFFVLCIILGAVFVGLLPLSQHLLTARSVLMLLAITFLLYRFPISWKYKTLFVVLGMSSFFISHSLSKSSSFFVDLTIFLIIIAALRLVSKLSQKIRS